MMDPDELIRCSTVKKHPLCFGPAESWATGSATGTVGRPCDTPPVSRGGAQRTCLGPVAVGGQAREYLGRQVTVADVEEMPEEEVARLYQRYEARLGAKMTKTLGSSMLQMYALAAGRVLPIPPESWAGLVEDLKMDPFLGHALTTFCCELFHRYGMFLALITNGAHNS